MDILWEAANLAERFVADTPAKLWFGCFAVGIVVETIFVSADSRPSARQYLTNMSHSVIYLAAIFFFAPTIFYSIATIRDAVGINGLIDLQILDNSTYLNQIVIAALFLFCLDFFQYWWHRAQHHFPFLWDQHVVHHSDEAVNVTTAARHHWTEFMLQAFAVALPLTLLFKISLPQTGIVAVLIGAVQFYLHSNLRISMGPLSRVIGGPQLHRIHHSIVPEHQNKNFAAYFPIWDVIFGTYRHPGKDEFPPTGVAGVRLDTVRSLTLYTFAMWACRLPLLRSRAR